MGDALFTFDGLGDLSISSLSFEEDYLIICLGAICRKFDLREIDRFFALFSIFSSGTDDRCF